uniref:Uncharacterized protein n=1 Tax=Rhizophora mucronata TaxID=61149 RepID=A0A2P2P4S4_RHIMU
MIDSNPNYRHYWNYSVIICKYSRKLIAVSWIHLTKFNFLKSAFFVLHFVTRHQNEHCKRISNFIGSNLTRRG